MIPGWHPFVVHFPLALGSTAALAMSSARLLRNDRHAAALATVGTWNLGAAAVAAVAALATGLAAVIGLHAGAAAQHAVSVHVKWAVLTSIMLVLLAVWRGSGGPQASRPSWLFVILLLAATGGLAATGYLGVQNVYRHGIGIGIGVAAPAAMITVDASRRRAS